MSIIRPRARASFAVTAAAAALLALTACVPEPSASASPSGTSPAPTSTPSGASVAPSAAPSDRPQAAEISLPASCDAVYSTGMRNTLDQQMPPLNDPGVTLTSTQVPAALGLLDSGVPTLRCSWGTASELGLSTNVSILALEDVPRLQDVLGVAGMVCADADGGILCTAGTPGTDETGESHFLRGNAWVATSWVGGLPDGYTQDIAATLWG